MKHTSHPISPMQSLRRAVRNRREHGMALLFTLCILSMALIVAMIFSSNASTDRKVAAAYVDTSAARILAEGTVSRAILALMSSNASYACSYYLKDTNDGGYAKGLKNTQPDEYASDWIWKLEKPGMFSFNDGPLRYSDKYYDRQDTRCPSWEYVFCNSPEFNADGNEVERIYGRYAYVAIGQNDQLNPNALGRRNGTDQPGYDDNIRKKRLGRWTCEPEFIFKDKDNLWGDNGNIFNTTNIINSWKTGGWSDLDVFFSDVLNASSSTVSDKDKPHLRMMVDQYFTLAGDEEYNKYNPDGDLVKYFNAVPTGKEQFRFPMIRTVQDWNNIQVADFRDSNRGIPFFINAKSDHRDQTIANLINYNASFSRPPVTDVQNWTTGLPTYTGNKCTPYINEVAGEIEVGGTLGIRMTERYLNANNDWLWRIWYTDCSYYHTFTLKIETWNMYGGNAHPVSAPIPIGSVTYEYLNPEAGRWIQQEINFDANNTKWDNNPGAGVQNGAYTTYTYLIDDGSVGSVTTQKRDGYSRPMGNERDFYPDIKVRNVRIRLDRVLLRDTTGQNADLALMNGDFGLGDGVMLVNGEHVVAGSGDAGKRGYFDLQVDDPRCNLGRDAWVSRTVTDMTSCFANLGYQNNVVSYDANKPTEFDPGENLDSISTAYIPHFPMESLWELGAIHRGSPWQTINLRCAANNNNAMGDYSAGDGNLLDQVALVSPDEQRETVLGLINLNCVADLTGGGAPFVFKSLFTGFPMYNTIDNMRNDRIQYTLEGGAVNSDDTEADRYAQDLVDSVTYAVQSGSKQRRTAIFPTTAASSSHNKKLFPDSGPDSQREEVVCRIINILKWSRQQTRRATVLAIAQTIQDVGGPKDTGKVGSSDSGIKLSRNFSEDNDSVLMDSGFKAYDAYDPDTKTTKLIETSLFPNAQRIRDAYKERTVRLKQYDNFYDRITGEAKVVVRLEWDDSANNGNGAWKVTRKEYAE